MWRMATKLDTTALECELFTLRNDVVGPQYVTRLVKEYK
jgi:hypothetical protein